MFYYENGLTRWVIFYRDGKSNEEVVGEVFTKQSAEWVVNALNKYIKEQDGTGTD